MFTLWVAAEIILASTSLFQVCKGVYELLSLNVINEISKHVQIGAVEYLGSESRELLIECAYVSRDWGQTEDIDPLNKA